ncbi:MAG TPA: hypothetical protein VER17_18990 [Tepidisphaeraceae bacterium]|nr:hypothetical protein [Tepidisphaeraceae bacterium]
MCSTRNKLARGLLLLLGTIAGGAAATGGCQRTIPPMQERLNNTPLVVDEAMQRRDWEPSVSYYANGDTRAGGTGYMFNVHETMPAWTRRAADPLVAVGNMLALPVGVFVNSPAKEMSYQGSIIPPTHTAQPPLPQ